MEALLFQPPGARAVAEQCAAAALAALRGQGAPRAVALRHWLYQPDRRPGRQGMEGEPGEKRERSVSDIVWEQPQCATQYRTMY